MCFFFLVESCLLPWFKNETSLILKANSEAYPESCETSEMELFTKIVNGFSFLIIFTKSFIIDVWQDSEFVSEASKDLWKNLHLRRLTRLWTHLCNNYFWKTAYICYLNLINILHHVSSKYSIAHGQVHKTLVSTYLLNSENYCSVSWPCLSIDYVLTALRVVF